MENFKARVEAFLVKYQVAPCTFGKLTINDPGFIARLRAGSRPRIDTIDRVDAWMEAYEKRHAARAAAALKAMQSAA